MDEPGVDMPISPQTLADSCSDGRAVRKMLLRERLRKSPPWSFPVGVWRIVLAPNSYKSRARKGVGATDPVLETPHASACFSNLMLATRVSGFAPRSWHLSGGFTISKGNRKEGYAGQRLLHALDGMGKAYYKWVWWDTGLDPGRVYASGYAKSRRRERSILTQALCAHRAARAKLSTRTDFYDATNAFASVPQRRLVGYASQCGDQFRAELLPQRLKYAAMLLPCSDGELSITINSGTLPGDSIACNWFLGPYHEATDGFFDRAGDKIEVQCSWLDSAICDDPAEQAEVRGWGRNKNNISCTSYADDIAKQRRVRGMQGFLESSNRHSAALEEELWSINVKSNRSKQESLTAFRGKDSMAEMRCLYSGMVPTGGKIVRSARYLDPRLQYNGALTTEQKRKLADARKSFYTMGPFWSRTRNIKWKSILFQCMVSGILTTAMCAFAVTKTLATALDAFQ